MKCQREQDLAHHLTMRRHRNHLVLPELQSIARKRRRRHRVDPGHEQDAGGERQSPRRGELGRCHEGCEAGDFGKRAARPCSPASSYEPHSQQTREDQHISQAVQHESRGAQEHPHILESYRRFRRTPHPQAVRQGQTGLRGLTSGPFGPRCRCLASSSESRIEQPGTQRHRQSERPRRHSDQEQQIPQSGSRPCLRQRERSPQAGRKAHRHRPRQAVLNSHEVAQHVRLTLGRFVHDVVLEPEVKPEEDRCAQEHEERAALAHVHEAHQHYRGRGGNSQGYHRRQQKHRNAGDPVERARA